MDDVSKLGPLWVSQLRKDVAGRRNRAAESLARVNAQGSYAEQHRMLIESADLMLAAPDLKAALTACLKRLVADCSDKSCVEIMEARAALTAAGVA